MSQTSKTWAKAPLPIFRMTLQFLWSGELKQAQLPINQFRSIIVMSANCQQHFIESDLRINFKLQEYRNKLQQLIFREKQLQRHIDSQDQQLSLLRSQLHRCSTQSNTACCQLSQLQLQLKDVRKNNIQLSLANEKLKHKAAEHDNEMHQLRKVNQDSQLTVQRLQTQNGLLRQKLKQIQLASSSFEQTASQNKQKCVTLSEENKSLIEQMARAKRALEKEDQVKQNQKRERQKNQQQIKLLKESQKKLQNQINKLQSQNNSLSKEKSQTASIAKSQGHALQTKLKYSLQEKQDLSRELAELRSQLEKCQRERQQLQELMVRCKERHQSQLKLLKRKIQLQRIKDLQLTAYGRVVQEFQSILKLSIS